MRTTRSSPYGGVLWPWGTLGQRPLRTETPQTETPGQRPPLEGTWEQAARQEMTSYRDPLPCELNDRHV